MSASNQRLLRINEVLNIVQVSRPTIYRLVSKGEFPRPVCIGASRLWPETEINQWMTDRLEERHHAI
jgi:prophage regulatory protein